MTSNPSDSRPLFIDRVEKIMDRPQDFKYYYTPDTLIHHQVKVDESALDFDDKAYIIWNEFGPVMLVFASHESEAWEVYVDCCEPVPYDQVHEAYGAYDALRDHMIKNLFYEDTYELRNFCNRWARTYYNIMAPKAEHDDDPCSSLIEGYEYQSNSTDSGIVETGHYHDLKQVSKSRIFALPKD
jgi:formylmethanofuran dehydrogenase subunit E-like metal-binding protein